LPTSSPGPDLSSASLTESIARLALTKKAEGIVALEVKALTSITDYFVICSADTDIQVKAICDTLRQELPIKPWRMEGYDHLRWVLLDYVDVVVHIFRTDERHYYNLESLWADAPRREYMDAPESVPNSRPS